LFECECLEAFGFDGFDCKRYLLAALAGAVVCVAVVVAVVTSCVGSRPQDTRIMGCGGVAGSRGQRQRQPIDIDSYSRECIYTRAQICGTEVSRWREVTGLVQSGCHCHPPPIQL